MKYRVEIPHTVWTVHHVQAETPAAAIALAKAGHGDSGERLEGGSDTPYIERDRRVLGGMQTADRWEAHKLAAGNRQYSARWYAKRAKARIDVTVEDGQDQQWWAVY